MIEDDLGEIEVTIFTGESEGIVELYPDEGSAEDYAGHHSRVSSYDVKIPNSLMDYLNTGYRRGSYIIEDSDGEPWKVDVSPAKGNDENKRDAFKESDNE